jgi:hypothetical protein
VLDQNGVVRAFGADTNGKLGNLLSLPGGQTLISAGWRHSLSLGGTIWAWGRNNEGQLGNGTNNSSSVPVLVVK